MPHGKRLTTEKYIERAIKKHGEKYDYSKAIYVHSMEPIELICNQHGSFNIVASSHLSGKGCQKCGRDGTKGTTEEFVAKAKVLYGDRFDYSKTFYNTLRTKLEITCREHGPFKLYPYAHFTGNGGCRVCSGNKPMTTEGYIQRAKSIHGDLYDYSDASYISARAKVTIICRNHGKFEVTAIEHIREDRASNCKKCIYDSNRLSNEIFIERAREIHGDLYDYSLVDYYRADQKVKIICHKHGVFKQAPDHHWIGGGCNNCRGRVSKKETQWLDQLVIAKEHRQKTLIMASGKRYHVDAYVASTNTVYEFNGDYWHGNPMKFDGDTWNQRTNCIFGELYQKTLSKKQELILNNYNVISIWENDFKKSISLSKKNSLKPLAD